MRRSSWPAAAALVLLAGCGTSGAGVGEPYGAEPTGAAPSATATPDPWTVRDETAPEITCDGGEAVGGSVSVASEPAGDPDIGTTATTWRAGSSARDRLVTPRTYVRAAGASGPAAGDGRSVAVVWFDADDVPRAQLHIYRSGAGGWYVGDTYQCVSLLT